jgi:surface protein
MFNGATAFNQNIGNWNTANVISMSQMFYAAAAFNQNIGSWNTANVTTMSNMFNGAAAFNQNIGNWSLNAAVILTSMLNNSGMDCTNYGNTLIGWNANGSTPSDRVLGATGRTYGPTATAARANLVLATGSGGKGWTITGDRTPAGAASTSPTLCINTALTNITHTTYEATGIGLATGLPAGVTAGWLANVLTISGTPTDSGIFNYSIPVTGACGTVNATGTITVTPNNTITLSSAVGTDAQTKCINTAITDITYTTTGATGATFSGLPTGVSGSWIANVVTISGTPSVSGSNTYTVTLTGGCGTITSTATIDVLSTSSVSSSVTSCNTYTWSGSTYTTSGTYTKTLTNAASCDSVHTLTLTINSSNTGSSSATACNTYTWIGTTYTSTGAYTKTFTNAANCDSVHTLSLTINSSNTGNSALTQCNSYTWSGSTYTTSGTYTKTLTNVSSCDSIHTLNLTINYSTSSSVTVSQLGCYAWSLNAVTYTVSGNYSLTYTNAIGCDSIVTLYLTITPGVYLNAKAILSGPYVAAAALMHDSLRVNGLIPTTEPYTSSPYNKAAVGGTSGETVSNAILNVSGNNAIVDWVFIELRDAASNGTVVANNRALIQRDGDIVSSTDGTSPVYFPTVANGNYFVSIKHRNHLGVMSLNAISFSGCSTTSIDFTTSNAVYTTLCANPAQRKQIGSVYALWAGDANNNKNVKYNGLSNDKDALIYVLGISTPNNTVSRVYRMEDVNMDGKIRYNNTDNDRVIILNNVGVSTPNNVYFQHTPN